MNNHRDRIIQKLISDPYGIAMLMEDGEIEDTIAALVAVLSRRKRKAKPR